VLPPEHLGVVILNIIWLIYYFKHLIILIEEEEEMKRISTGKMVKQRSLNRILKVIKNNGVA
jgi:hypothetical protein